MCHLMLITLQFRKMILVYRLGVSSTIMAEHDFKVGGLEAAVGQNSLV